MVCYHVPQLAKPCDIIYCTFTNQFVLLHSDQLGLCCVRTIQHRPWLGTGAKGRAGEKVVEGGTY